MPSTKNSGKIVVTQSEALEFHEKPTKGKLGVQPTKPLMTARDLSLAYSPGVAYPCLEIEKDKQKAYDYTSKGNFVAVISNGTAVLGLGDLGSLASKPVMEGKSVLLKRFADIDSIDVEVDTKDPEDFIRTVRNIGETWGGINLEDIKAPECFIIESKLKELLDIPVFHDDQHGTAVISLAGIINAAAIAGKKLESLKIVANGAGAAGIACIELLKSYGVKHENVILCDTKGVIYKGRTDGMNQWKSAHAVETSARTLADALNGADVFLGLSVKGALTESMVASMAKNPIIFAMANPDPEITPEEVAAIRSDAIVATGRSDYPNQVNNVMGFPYIFRGALDVRASKINEEMKIAAAVALAELAKQSVPDEVMRAYPGRNLEFGPQYIIPTPFDPRLITVVSQSVAKAAMQSGVARKPIADWKKYDASLRSRLDPSGNMMNILYEKVAQSNKNICFSEGEEAEAIKAAILWRNAGYGTPVLVGRASRIEETAKSFGIKDSLAGIKIINAAVTQDKNEKYIDMLYNKLQRNGYLRRDCERMIKKDRNIFAACLLEAGDVDGLVVGLTKGFRSSLEDITMVIDKKDDNRVFGVSAIINQNSLVFMADTALHELASSQELADIAQQSASFVEKLGIKPRVAFMSFSNFGSTPTKEALRIREAVSILDGKKVNFEYDGEMNPAIALNKELQKLYPFMRLTDTANILIMPGLHSANISSNLLQELGGGTVIGPILVGLKKPVQVTRMRSSVNDLFNLAVLASFPA